MKTVKLISVIALILLTVLELKAKESYSSKQYNDTKYDDKPKIITVNHKTYNSRSIIKVPFGMIKQVIADGMFTNGEWEDALNYSIAENYEIYFKADTEILCIGLKSVLPIGECVCEIRITSDEKEVFLLHVSGELGEGVSGFPATTSFSVNKTKYWEANFSKSDTLKTKAWFDAGLPIELYDGTYEKKDGIEFIINRKKFTNNSLKFTIGWITIEVKENNYVKNKYNYPENASLKSADNWLDLILPTATNK